MVNVVFIYLIREIGITEKYGGCERYELLLRRTTRILFSFPCGQMV